MTRYRKDSSMKCEGLTADANREFWNGANYEGG